MPSADQGERLVLVIEPEPAREDAGFRLARQIIYFAGALVGLLILMAGGWAVLVFRGLVR